MTDKPDHRTMTNSESMFNGVGRALMCVGELPEEQRRDVISAALNALKITIVDDLSHTLIVDKPSGDELRHRLVDIARGSEEVRQSVLDRFVNLCELIPNAKIKIEVIKADQTEVSNAIH